MNTELLWNKILEELKPKVTSIVYEAWFKPIKLYKIDNNIATIIVPHKIHQKHIEEKYSTLLKEAFDKITNNIYDFELILETDFQKKQEQLSFIDDNSIKIKKEDNKQYQHSSNLNKKYNFDNFLIGDSNRLAAATALAVAKSPGESYNPLFIYGSSGLGKTHLMHAIGNYIEENTNKKVLYVSSKEFIDDFTRISRKDSNLTNYDYADFFQNKYHYVDVLIIDDIQFMTTTPKTQDEFFHTFNILHDEKKQIIISSDRSPNDLNKLEERLKTRFCWGVMVDIFPPELTLRKNIIIKKIAALNLSIEMKEEVIDYIAANISTDVRSLEGAINRLMSYSLMMGYNEINLSIAVDALKNIINKGTSEATNIQKIQKVVADPFKISVEDLKSKKRSASIAFPRQIAMYLSRTILNESFERIGLEFGGKDHTTVMHSCEKIKNEIDNKEETRKTVEDIKQNIP